SATAAAAVAWSVATGGAVALDIGSWVPPLGIRLAADGLSALFLVLAAIVGAAVSVDAALASRPGADVADRWLFWPLWLFLWSAVNGLFLTADVFNAYVCLELIGFSAVALVASKGSKAALDAALSYLFASVLGAMTYLVGVGLVYLASGTLALDALDSAVHGSASARIGLGLMLAGLVLKTALFPAHFWLPTAHSSAPPQVSAALSGVVVKSSYLLAVRLLVAATGAGSGPGLRLTLAALGAVAIVWGSAMALASQRLKLMIAYSTVAQVGYLFVMLPLLEERAATVGLAIALHALSHGMAKAAMFLAAGDIADAAGTDRFDALAGVGRERPVAALSLGLAGVTMLGLPPSGSFAAKWLVVQSSLASGQWWIAAVVVGGGLLAALYVFRALASLLAKPDRSEARTPKPRTAWAALPLAAVSATLLLAGPAISRLMAATSLAGR
ncbi:MAG: proton-conducting transporter membrane subunit, partial [Anaerosomatales bacterium]|nr:proton-conducting transporter membrane subunit [Anaerosomatales bacterium]